MDLELWTLLVLANNYSKLSNSLFTLHKIFPHFGLFMSICDREFDVSKHATLHCIHSAMLVHAELHQMGSMARNDVSVGRSTNAMDRN